MRITFIPVAVVLAIALGACGESGEPQPAKSVDGGDAKALQERVEKLESEAKQREAEAARKVRAAKRKARAAERRARAAAKRKREAANAEAVEVAAGGGGITVPSVVGLDHQAAQDALQGEGLWSLDEEDCTGQGRMLLWDRNWEVVSTDPPAGTPVSEETTITICSKKQGE
ncbi:MAG TPA: PASTA domain-containing protein [Solirubrobacteraceae bacterium]|nr:PASTA domain-containing protein [Solirubrobacteraceae bacterium]